MGKQLAAKAGAHMKKVVMGAGHAPVIVAEDADVEVAVKSIGMAKYRNAGQVCIAPTRLGSLTRTSRAPMSPTPESLKVGDGCAADTTMGPLVNGAACRPMEAIIADIKAKGGEIVTGGHRIGDVGNFFARRRWWSTRLVSPLEFQLPLLFRLWETR